jgi:DMSO reductase anchor subunit
MVPRAEPRSYYGRPVIKAPVWKPEIPWYFFAGGMAGASAAQALAADVTGNRELARRAWLVALAGVAVSPPLLISDLGRPERFFNMLRVFKVTSPMSVGSWVLGAMGTATAAAGATEVLGVFPRAGAAAKVAAGVLGLPLATYTAVLLANSAVPVWHEARRELPFLFAGGAAATAGAAVNAITPPGSAGPARRLAVLGAVMEETAMWMMERRLAELGRPYREGQSGRLARLSKTLTATGATVVAAGRRSRGAAVAGGLMLLAGGAATRWGVFKAGFASAADPAYTVAPQRSGTLA